MKHIPMWILLWIALSYLHLTIALEYIASTNFPSRLFLMELQTHLEMISERKPNPFWDQFYGKKSARILKTSNQHLLFKFYGNIFFFNWKWRFIQIMTFIWFYDHWHHYKCYLWKIIAIVSNTIINIFYTSNLTLNKVRTF